VRRAADAGREWRGRGSCGGEFRERVTEDLEKGLRPFRAAPGEGDAFRAVEVLARTPFLRGNTARLLVDGAAVFPAILDAIDAAKEYVLVQFYIVHDDGIVEFEIPQ